MSLPVNTAYITHPANRSNRKRTETRYLVLHETVSNADARRQLNYFNTGDRGANCHVFIDWKEVLVTLPLDEVGWHVGPKANAFTEGVELCRAANAADFKKQWDGAVEWFTYRCQVYGRGTDMILSHHEVGKKFGGTDHTDPDEYFAMFGKTVNDFRNAVAAELAKNTAPAASLKIAPDAAREAILQMQSLTRTADKDARIAYNYAANAARKGAQITVEQVLGVPQREDAERVCDILGDLWHLTDRADVRVAYSVMADALRDATGLPH
ncbi:peptidoglycan recognition family protein [Tumebacillus sp. DT12]|uniref:N-acetylmuramoyl-L-alanine amidase n=1 Tax=Tumebacillus lacus TaxID=2995335 RepID=A0ABT3WVG7_9BACL|nr:peptidoglycan recognition family protein [Tumebacillus lacus]MCX7568629.1 peptidoglycan recognition family protein [Tumebacillus lacus]